MRKNNSASTSRVGFQISRRSFLRRSLALAAATGLPSWYLEELSGHAATPAPRSANDRPNIAWIGCGGRGTGITKEASALGNVVAVCDVDSEHVDKAKALYPGAARYGDFRNALDRKDVELVINGTPDHWHTLINIAAVRRGKDVYCEKPLTLTIDEGRRLVAEVQKAGRILQTGSQQRSDARFRLACELVQNGRIGKLTNIITILPMGPRLGPFAAAPVPKALDWEFWQGQTPVVDYIPQRCHSSFRYWYDYSGGTMTDWGAHHNDIALWALGPDIKGPVEISGMRTVDPIPGGFTAASEYEVHYKYANGVTHLCKSTPNENPSGGRTKPVSEAPEENGVRFEGTHGWIFVNRGRITASSPEILTQPLGSGARRLYLSPNHMGNFFDCARSRKQPVCNAETGHRSVSVCHLGVLAIRLGKTLHWDPRGERFTGDKDANQYLSRPMRKPWSYEYV